jgi:hypothetical protein
LLLLELNPRQKESKNMTKDGNVINKFLQYLLAFCIKVAADLLFFLFEKQNSHTIQRKIQSLCLVALETALVEGKVPQQLQEQLKIFMRSQKKKVKVEKSKEQADISPRRS